MSSKNYKIHGDRKVLWEKIINNGCTRIEGINELHIEITDIEWSMGVAKGDIFDRTVRRMCGTGSNKVAFWVPHDITGEKILLHYKQFSAAQRVYAINEIEKQKQSIAKSYNYLSPKIKALNDQLAKVSNFVLPYVVNSDWKTHD